MLYWVAIFVGLGPMTVKCQEDGDLSHVAGTSCPFFDTVFRGNALLPDFGLGPSMAAPGLRRHEERAPFSGAIIDPLKVHHAPIEDEQRVNLFLADDQRTSDGRSPDAFTASLELAAT